MFRLDNHRSPPAFRLSRALFVPFPALFALLISFCFAAPEPARSQAPAPASPAPATPSPSVAPAPAPPPPAAPAPASAASTPGAIPAAPPATPEQLGDSLVAHQRYQAAIAAYSQAPHTATLWNKLGIAYQMMFNSGDATRCYRASLKIDPRNSQVLNNLGTVYDSLKDYGTAEHLYRRALKIDPHSALILKNLGTNLLARRKYSRGWEAYKQALALDPRIFEDRNSPQVQNPASIQERGAMNYYMALGCVRAGQTECALQYLRMALDEGFTNPKKIASDLAFASLRENPDFKQLLASETNSKPPHPPRPANDPLPPESPQVPKSLSPLVP